MRKKEISIRGLLVSFAILTVLSGIVFAISTGAGFPVAQNYQNLYGKVMVCKGTHADADNLLLVGRLFKNVFYIQLVLSFIIAVVGTVIAVCKWNLYKEMVYLCLIANSIFGIILAITFNGASYIASVPAAVFLAGVCVKRRIPFASGFIYAVVTGICVFPILLMVNQSLRSSLPLFLGGGLCVFATLFFVQGILLEMQKKKL